MPITSLTIDGVEVNPLVEGFEIRETEGGVSTLVCEIPSVGSPVLRFTVRQEIEAVEDGEKVFSGLLTQVRERGHGGPNLFDTVTDAPEIISTLTAEDHTGLADRAYLTATVTAGTLLKDFLTTIVAGELGDLGVTLHASQVNGPALPDLTYRLERVSSVLQKLSEGTGYLWRIDYNKQLRMWAPGTLAAPFDIDEDDVPPKWTDDVEVETILGDNFANRVTVLVGPLAVTGWVETFTGDGVTTIFQLNAVPGIVPGYVTDDTGTVPVTNRTLTTTPFQGSADWTYHSANNTLERDLGPLPNGQVASIQFDGTLYLVGFAEDAASIAADGLYHHVEQRDDATTQAAVDALAADILAQRLAAGDQIATYFTRYTAPTLRAGQAQTLTSSLRLLSGSYIITDMSVQAETPVTTAYATSDLGFIRKVTAKKNKAGKWQHTYDDWLKFGRGGVAVTGGTPVSSGPAPPDESVQSNQSGAFYGKDTFLFKAAGDSVILGPNNVITAVNYVGCLIVGEDNEISD